jgi:protein-S-isoprenylcysteine O-methyltransferase Ste14
MNRPLDSHGATRLPSLGRRGEGWVAGQLVLMAGVFASPLLGGGWSGPWAIAGPAVGWTLSALGLLLLGAGAVRLGSSLTPYPAPRSDGGLRVDGPYRLCRHPIYGGGILIALGWAIAFATPAGLALTAVLAVFLDLKATREEAWLTERVEGYEAYRERTRHRLLPFVW